MRSSGRFDYHLNIHLNRRPEVIRRQRIAAHTDNAIRLAESIGWI